MKKILPLSKRFHFSVEIYFLTSENFTESQRESIAGAFISQKFQKGENIVNEGDDANSFYLIKEGNVIVLKGSKEVRKMGSGETFGEQALYYNTTRACSIRTVDPTTVVSLGREKMIEIFGNKVSTIMYQNVHKWSFQKSPILSKLTKLQMEKLNDVIEFQSKNKDEIIFEKNKAIKKIIVVIEGKICKENGGGKAYGKGSLIGDLYLTKQDVM